MAPFTMPRWDVGETGDVKQRFSAPDNYDVNSRQLNTKRGRSSEIGVCLVSSFVDNTSSAALSLTSIATN